MCATQSHSPGPKSTGIAPMCSFLSSSLWSPTSSVKAGQGLPGDRMTGPRPHTEVAESTCDSPTVLFPCYTWADGCLPWLVSHPGGPHYRPVPGARPPSVAPHLPSPGTPCGGCRAASWCGSALPGCTDAAGGWPRLHPQQPEGHRGDRAPFPGEGEGEGHHGHQVPGPLVRTQTSPRT